MPSSQPSTSRFRDGRRSCRQRIRREHSRRPREGVFDEIQDKSRQLESQHKSQFLRTPLNAILGYTELMADGAYGEPSEKMLGTATRSGAAQLEYRRPDYFQRASPGLPVSFKGGTRRAADRGAPDKYLEEVRVDFRRPEQK